MALVLDGQAQRLGVRAAVGARAKRQWHPLETRGPLWYHHKDGYVFITR